MTEQIERIMNMEERLDRVMKALQDLQNAMEQLEAVKKDVDALSDYYENGTWRQDYEADEAGMLPKDLKRGVLSQDALYDILSEFDTLEKQIRATD